MSELELLIWVGLGALGLSLLIGDWWSLIVHSRAKYRKDWDSEL